MPNIYHVLNPEAVETYRMVSVVLTALLNI